MRIQKYKNKPLSGKKKSRLGLKLFILVIVFFVFAVGNFYLIIFSSVFQINKISVNGAKDVKSEEIQKIADDILSVKFLNKIPKNNLIFLPEQEITRSILNDFPKIKEVTLTKKFMDHTLVINIIERESSAIWCRVLPEESFLVSSSSAGQLPNQAPQAENCFFADAGGFIFGEAPILSGGAVPTVYEQTASAINIKDKVSNPRTLEFILAAKKELTAVNLNLTDFVIKSQSLGDLEILTPEGWIIYLDISNSPASQVNALKRVLEEEIKENRNRLEYIDLRVPDRAYYKLK